MHKLYTAIFSLPMFFPLWTIDILLSNHSCDIRAGGNSKMPPHYALKLRWTTKKNSIPKWHWLVHGFRLEVLDGILGDSTNVELFVAKVQVVGDDVAAVAVWLLPRQCNGGGCGGVADGHDGCRTRRRGHTRPHGTVGTWPSTIDCLKRNKTKS